MITRFLPPKLRVALSTARKDARDTVRAFVEPRYKGARVRHGAPRPPKGGERPRRPKGQPAAPQTSEKSSLVFAESGVELSVEPGQSILEAGLRNNVDLLFSCTLGGCGACMLKIVEGEVEYEDPDAICLTEGEIEEGYCLACVGRPRGRLVVEA